MAAFLTLAPAASSNLPIDIVALTGGATGEFLLKGFDGSDYMVQSTAYQNLKFSGGDQLRYTLFADSGALPTYGFETTGNPAGGGNYGGWVCDGANKGLRWQARVSRSSKRLLCASDIGGTSSFTVKAHLSDGSQPDATLVLNPGGKRWWTCDWRSVAEPDETVTIDFEIRSSGPGSIRIPFMYIPPAVAPYRPKGVW